MNSQQIRNSMAHGICERLFEKLNERLELLRLQCRVVSNHFYDYCKVYSEKLGGVLDPFVVLEAITASILDSLRCSQIRRSDLAYNMLQQLVTGELFKDDKLREAIRQGVVKLIEHMSRLSRWSNRVGFKQNNYSSIIVENVDLILFYRSSGSIMVFNDISGGFVEGKLSCPLSSWVKGYLRLLLHKLVFVYALKEIVDSDRADLADLYTLYVYLLSGDDEDIVVRIPGCGVDMVNLVGVLMGCGGFASLLRVYRVASESGCSCVYRLDVERERIPYTVSLVQHLHGFLEKLGVKVGDVVAMLEYFDDVVAVLASWASSALDGRGYRFLPFTASYPRVHNQLPSQYVFSKTRASEADVGRHLEVFLGLLKSYTLHLIDIVKRCRR